MSSAINSTYYLGIGCTGLCGGAILQKWRIASIGIMGPFISAIIVFSLSSFNYISPWVGLPTIFFIFLLNGIDHPNNMRFFNEAIPEDKKLSFFSLTEGINAFFSISAPIIASYIITAYGIKLCFMIDGCTYLISCIPWILMKRKNNTQKAIEST